MKRPKWTGDYLGKRNYTIGEQAAADLAIRSAAKAFDWPADEKVK